jgi:hypothetical protein
LSSRDHAKTARDLCALALGASTQAEAQAAWGRALVVAREHGVALTDLLPPPAPEGVTQERHERGLREAFERGAKLGHERGERRGYDRGVARAVGLAEQMVDQAVLEARRARAKGHRAGDPLDAVDELLARHDGTGDARGISGFPPPHGPRRGPR